MRHLIPALSICMVLALTRQGHAAAGNETAMLRTIREARASRPLDALTAVVRQATACCADSAAVGGALTAWLREDHPLYAGRLPYEAAQFRGFLLASMAAFPPDEERYGYLKAELQFPAHPFSIAAAAVAARRFPDRADELLPLFEPFLRDTFQDEWVDVTTPELIYPPAQPTRVRDEILRTLVAFGPRAWGAMPSLEAIKACPHCGSWGADPALGRKASEAAEAIRKATPPCCRKQPEPAATGSGLRFIAAADRKPFSAGSLPLRDQDDRPLRLAGLRGKPFVLTFFYTQCPNATKCVMTVRLLRDLATACAQDGLAARVGIYGMTYDPAFDSAAILRQHGRRHGFPFGPNVRLLRAEADGGEALRDALRLRVSYGGGSVNHHGVQLFVFDRSGRLAAVSENEVWSPVEVRKALGRLAAEDEPGQF
ncbi:MAG TPA: SCO family protein [Thermoanaerobaculia bacterium]|jgi:cytochrome oxidase Cu insertion factor (SCO1/SenC/PrrC family)